MQKNDVITWDIRKVGFLVAVKMALFIADLVKRIIVIIYFDRSNNETHAHYIYYGGRNGHGDNLAAFQLQCRLFGASFSCYQDRLKKDGRKFNKRVQNILIQQQSVVLDALYDSYEVSVFSGTGHKSCDIGLRDMSQSQKYLH